MLVKMWEGAVIYFLWVCKEVWSLEIDMEVTQKKSNIELPQDPTLSFLGTHLKDSVYHYRDICTCLSVDTLFIIARE